MKLLTLFIAAMLLLPACGRRGDLIIPGTVLPQAPAGLEADPRGDVVLLGWTIPGKDTEGGPAGDVAGFVVMRAALPEDTGECPCQFEEVGYVDMEMPGLALVKGSRVAWPDSAPGLVSGGRYAYKVAAVDAGGFTGPGSGVIKVRLLTPPAPPGELTAKAGNRAVTLNWETDAADASGGAAADLAGVNVYRSFDKGSFPARPVNPAPVRGDNYLDSGLVNGTVYYYRLTSLRGAERPYTEGEPSPAVAATPVDDVPPCVPTGLRVVPGEGYALMSWDPCADADLAGYVVYRQSGEDAVPRPVARLAPGVITYKDAGAASGVEYTYSVSAFDDASPVNEGARSEGYAVRLP